MSDDEDINPAPIVSNNVPPPPVDEAPEEDFRPPQVSNNVPPPDQPGVAEELPVTKITSVTLWQARLVLKNHGLFDTIDAYVTAHKDDIPQLDQVWNYGNFVSRTSPLILSIGAMLGLTDEQIDAMFQEAAALTA
jgi:hypothetical protein